MVRERKVVVEAMVEVWRRGCGCQCCRRCADEVKGSRRGKEKGVAEVEMRGCGW